MKSVGIFICNYNKREFVVNCVKSILEQSFDDFDLFVVDNASTDDSVEKLREIYGDKITIIQNSENLGGSGGFNTGIRRGYKAGYKYIMLVDNDTFFDKEAVGELYNFLENNKDVGMAGAKILQMQKPEYIQEFGGKIYWDRYTMYGIINDKIDSNDLPDVQESDYLAACALMVKREVIDKIGFLNESCFIYYDDGEWTHKCNLAGYKCFAIGKAKVWHNASWATNVEEKLGFQKYYSIRNNFNFFARYIKENDIEKFAEFAVSYVYKCLLGYYCKKQYDMLPIIIYALEDFLHNARGKAEEHKIKRSLENNEPLLELLIASEKVLINVSAQELSDTLSRVETFFGFIRRCKKINPNLKIYVDEKDWNNEEMLEIKQNVDIEVKKDEVYDLNIYFCRHISQLNECLLPMICVDTYLNCIYNKDIYNIYKGMLENEKMFIKAYKKIFIESIYKIREVELRTDGKNK